MAIIVGLQTGITAAPIRTTPIPRIDIKGLGKGKNLLEFSEMYVFGTTKAKVKYANWKGVKGKSYYISYFFGASAGNWILIGTQFTPTASGMVQISLMAQPGSKGQREKVVYFDQLTVIGAKLKNAEFEKHNSLIPTGWKRKYMKKKHNIVSGIVFKPVKNGKCAVQVSHDYCLTQTFKVTKGEKVIIEVWVYPKL